MIFNFAQKEKHRKNEFKTLLNYKMYESILLSNQKKKKDEEEEEIFWGERG